MNLDKVCKILKNHPRPILKLSYRDKTTTCIYMRGSLLIERLIYPIIKHTSTFTFYLLHIKLFQPFAITVFLMRFAGILGVVLPILRRPRYTTPQWVFPEGVHGFIGSKLASSTCWLASPLRCPSATCLHPVWTRRSSL